MFWGSVQTSQFVEGVCATTGRKVSNGQQTTWALRNQIMPKIMYCCLPDLVEAVNLLHPRCIQDSSGYLILHCSRSWVKISLLRLCIFQSRELLLLVSSPGHSRVPRRSVVTLISGLQDQASAWLSGDLLLLLVPESIREIHGLWPPSAMLGTREWGLTRDVR